MQGLLSHEVSLLSDINRYIYAVSAAEERVIKALGYLKDFFQRIGDDSNQSQLSVEAREYGLAGRIPEVILKQILIGFGEAVVAKRERRASEG